jgi:hypothetical protein
MNQSQVKRLHQAGSLRCYWWRVIRRQIGCWRLLPFKEVTHATLYVCSFSFAGIAGWRGYFCQRRTSGHD